jgi:hypothetical protein
VAGLSGSWKTLSTGNRIGTAALRTADSDGIPAAMVPVPVLLSRYFHANDVAAVAEPNTVTRKEQHVPVYATSERVYDGSQSDSSTVDGRRCAVYHIIGEYARGVVARLFATGQITCERAGPVPSSCPSRASGARKSSQQPAASTQPAWTP